MTKITKDIVDGMYRFCGIDYNALRHGLVHLGEQGLLDEGWTKENPFKNNSYTVAECIYHFLAPVGSEPYKVQIAEVLPDEWNKGHRDKYQYWVMWPNRLIVDLAMEHFEYTENLPDYKLSKPFKFHKPTPTIKAKRLSEYLKDLQGHKIVEE